MTTKANRRTVRLYPLAVEQEAVMAYDEWDDRGVPVRDGFQLGDIVTITEVLPPKPGWPANHYRYAVSGVVRRTGKPDTGRVAVVVRSQIKPLPRQQWRWQSADPYHVATAEERVTELEAENARLRAALEVYADPMTWDNDFANGGATFYGHLDDDTNCPKYDPWDPAREALNG